VFTGIIEATGFIAKLEKANGDLTVRINSGKLDLSDVKLGDSIATNGVCLTVTALHRDGYSADVSAETLSLTKFEQYKTNQMVNLEKALTINARLGGHLVSGHIDGIAEIIAINKLARATEYWLKTEHKLSRYISYKGSVCIDGVSLTVNAIEDSRFKLTIIPHTVQETIMQHYQVGTSVNIEVDQIARYLERIISQPASKSESSKISQTLLAQAVFIK